jgi:Na+-driven multidrug efflux pump
MEPEWLRSVIRNMNRSLATSLGAVAGPVVVGILLALLFAAPCSSAVCFGPLPDWGILIVIAAMPAGAFAMRAIGKRNDWY